MAIPKNTLADYQKLGNAEWSDNLGYLQTIDWLIRTGHEASIDDDDVYDWFMILEQLHIEVDGQLINKKNWTEETPDQKKLEDTRLICKTAMMNARKANKPLIELRETVRPYHMMLNRLIHREQLRMRNEGGGITNPFA